jgi:hypothetical protein
MKIALICFHKNIKRYPDEWIIDYRNSILNQTYKDFDIFELNYGGKEEIIFNNSFFISEELEDHAEAHNKLLDICFNKGYEYVLNTNVDDYYPINRISLQVQNYNTDYAVISGNYQGFSDYNNHLASTNFHNMNIDTEFSKNHNIIAHPACGYTRKFLEFREKLISQEIPADDFCMWKRMRSKGAQFKIIPEVLMYYRISNLKTKLS